jgi:anthranilate phosphoribosyltransferase
MTDFNQLLGRVATGEPLSVEEAQAAFEVMMTGGATTAQMGAFVMGLRVRGETVEEITGGAIVLRAFARMLKAPEGAIDTCGTGGDACGTYNISTAAGLVVAGCGVPVAKHGNKAQSSKTGAADVLNALGVNIDTDIEHIERSIVEAGFGFMAAPNHHSAMRFVAPVRQELKGVRTIFNLLGPLANPAGTKRQLLGVFSRQWLEPFAQVLRNLGSEKVWIVHGGDGLDELTTTAASHVTVLEDGEIRSFIVTPEDAGLKRADPAALKGDDAAHNADALRRLLDGKEGAYRDIVLLNAAAALIVAGRVETLADGVEMAAHSIASGRAADVLQKVIDITAPAKALP